MSSQFTVVYERSLDFEIKVSRRAADDVRMRRIERWPREAGLTLPLDETGLNLLQLIKQYAADYKISPGDKSWSTRRENGKIVVELEWKLLKDGSAVGAARAVFEISLSSAREEGDNLVYPVKIKYVIELRNDVLSSARSEGLSELAGLGP